MDKDFDLDQSVVLMPETLNIPLTEVERPGVVLQMRRTADLPMQVMEFDVAQDLEPAPVFKALKPRACSAPRRPRSRWRRGVARFARLTCSAPPSHRSRRLTRRLTPSRNSPSIGLAPKRPRSICWSPPATPCVPQPLWRENMSLDGQNLPVRPTMGWFTQSLTLIGLPTVVVPVPVAEQALPIGLQIIAAPWRETDALWVAQQLGGRGGGANSPCRRLSNPGGERSRLPGSRFRECSL